MEFVVTVLFVNPKEGCPPHAVTLRYNRQATADDIAAYLNGFADIKAMVHSDPPKIGQVAS